MIHRNLCLSAALVLGAASAGAGRCRAAGEPAGRALASAEKHRLAGETSAAEAELRGVLSADPGNPQALRELALVYDDASRLADEADVLSRLVAASPRDFADRFQLAHVEIALGRTKEAREMFARARQIGVSTASASAYVEEGYFDMNAGAASRAREDFSNAIAVDTADPHAYQHMGSFLVDSGRPAEGEKYLRAALEMLDADSRVADEDRADTIAWLGLAVQKQGRLSEAEALYLRGKKIEASLPTNGRKMRLLRSLGMLYMEEKKPADAEAAFKEAVAVCAERLKCRHWYAAVPRVDLAAFYAAGGRRAEAEEMARQAEEFGEDIPLGEGRLQALRDLAGLYARLGDVDKEDALYARLLPLRRALPYSPDLVWVETGMADRAAAASRFQSAENLYARAVEIMRHDGYREKEAEFLEALAAVEDRDGKPAAGKKHRERAKTLRGADAESR